MIKCLIKHNNKEIDRYYVLGGDNYSDDDVKRFTEAYAETNFYYQLPKNNLSYEVIRY